MLPHAVCSYSLTMLHVNVARLRCMSMLHEYNGKNELRNENEHENENEQDTTDTTKPVMDNKDIDTEMDTDMDKDRDTETKTRTRRSLIFIFQLVTVLLSVFASLRLFPPQLKLSVSLRSGTNPSVSLLCEKNIASN
jgi:hypothetical protein